MNRIASYLKKNWLGLIVALLLGAFITLLATVKADDGPDCQTCSEIGK